MTGQQIDLAAIADAVGEPLATRLREGSADAIPVATPGLGDDVVWLVADDLADHPLEAYVGRRSDGSVALLTDDPDAWDDLAADVGVHLDDAADALGYVRVFLEATRAPMVFVQEVSGPGEFPWRPGTPDEEERRDRLIASDLVQPPSVDETDDGFDVTLTLVVDQRVQRNHFALSRDGALTTSFEILAEGLPLPVVR
jgi:hypothetical protein